jgi:hypothetical protein
MLLQLAWRIDPRLEPVAISSESYEKDTWIPLIYEIREKGIVVEAEPVLTLPILLDQ